MADFHETISGATWLTNLEPLLELDGYIQNVKYFRSQEFGRVLVINGELQHVEAWAPFYHEIIVHLPSSFIPKPKNALVLGGGSLFAAEELLKYETIVELDLVDHDTNVIRATVQAYPERTHVADSKRLKIIQSDWKAFLLQNRKRYDIIINDCTDLYSVSKSDDRDLYAIIYDTLTEDGICSDLLYRSLYNRGFSEGALQELARYSNKAASLLAVPEYPGIFHMLTMWGKNIHLRQDQSEVINSNQYSMYRDGLLKVYSPSFLPFYLYLPPYLKSYIK